MKPSQFFIFAILLFHLSSSPAQEDSLTEIPLGQPGETKLIHVSPSPHFTRDGIIKYSTSNDRLHVNLKPGRYFYRFRSNSNAQRAISKSGRIEVDAATASQPAKTDYSIAWTPPVDPQTSSKIPFFWSVTDSKGNFVIRDQVIVEENPIVQLLHPGTYFWTMTDEIGASWTVPKQLIVNPFPPASVQAVVNKDRSVDISWKASANLEGFVVKVTDQEGYEVFSSTLNERFISVLHLPPGFYKINVHGTMVLNGRFGTDSDPSINLISKPIATTFEIQAGDSNTPASPVIIMSPVDRIHFDGQKYIFSWHVKSPNPPKKYRLQVKRRDNAGNFNDVKQNDVIGFYDESIFQTLPLGHYKFRVAALNDKDEPIPGWSDKAEFSIESKVAEARLGRVANDAVTFGPEMGFMNYLSTSESTSNSFSAQMVGFFLRSENTGAASSEIDPKFSYTMKEVRTLFYPQGSQTLLNSELTFGFGQSSSPSKDGWITKYGLHTSILRAPDIVGGAAAQVGQINFLSFRPRLEIGKVNRQFSYQFSFEISMPVLQISDVMTVTRDPLSRAALSYRAAADMQFPFFWPWSAGAQVGYEKNDFRYRSPQSSNVTDATLSGVGIKLYLNYPY